MPERTIDLNGPVHFLEVNGPADGPVFVCVHGLAGHHATWLTLARLLSARGRVLAPDLPGFGLTPLRDRRATMTGMRLLLDRFIDATTDRPVVLVGNSMGGTLAMMQAHVRPERVEALVLVAPAVPRPVTEPVEPRIALTFGVSLIPGVGEATYKRRVRRVGYPHLATEALAFCTVDASRVPAEIVEAGLALAERRATHDGAARAFLQATRSLTMMLARRRSFLRMVRAISVPTLIVAGRRDRVVPFTTVVAVADARSDWRLAVFDDLGHIPMAEDPPRTGEAILSWLDEQQDEAPGIAAGGVS